MMNNKTTTETREKVVQILFWNWDKRDDTNGEVIDQIMHLIAKEKKTLLEKVSDDLSQIFSNHRDFKKKESIRRDVAEYFIKFWKVR